MIKNIESGCNEFDTPEEKTQNYIEFCKALNNLSLRDIIQITNRMATLSALVSTEPEFEDATNEVLYPLRKIINDLITDKKCPKCGKPLFKSDLPQYDYICVECDENF